MGLFTEWEPKGDYNQQNRAIREERRKLFEIQLKKDLSLRGLRFVKDLEKGEILSFVNHDEIRTAFPHCTLAINDPDVGLQLIGQTSLYRICATLRKPYIGLGEFLPNDEPENWHELI